MLSHCVSRQVSSSWRVFLLLSLCLQLTSWTLVIYWARRHWHNHPISCVLQAHVQPPHLGWGSVAASVNTEFRRIDKFATGAPGARVIVTDSWVLKVSEGLHTTPLISPTLYTAQKFLLEESQMAVEWCLASDLWTTADRKETGLSKLI